MLFLTRTLLLIKFVYTFVYAIMGQIDRAGGHGGGVQMCCKKEDVAKPRLKTKLTQTHQSLKDLS
ncbi:MAG: hypothetical protein EBS81_08610 [Gammaproteobacteria bacterium]|nr:hypothetical protein [Gammaproteobacteria bacterium]